MIWLALYLLFQFLDFLTTAMGLRNPKVVEGNPVLASIMRRVGAIPALAICKLATSLAGVYLAYFGPLWLLAVLCGLYAFVVLNNLRVIWRERG